MAKAGADAKKDAAEPVSHALAFQEVRNGVKIQTNVAFVGPAKAVKLEMTKVLAAHEDSEG